MKKFLKRFIKLSWKGIPVGIIASVLIGTAVLAAVLIPIVTQTITQDIEEAPVPPDYGTITAPGIALTSVVAGNTFSQPFEDAVLVDVGADSVNGYLHLVLDDTTTGLYNAYSVTITSLAVDNPTSVDITLTVTLAGTSNLIQLPLEGLYTFDETIAGTAGPAAGSSAVEVDISLDTTP